MSKLYLLIPGWKRYCFSLTLQKIIVRTRRFLFTRIKAAIKWRVWQNLSSRKQNSRSVFLQSFKKVVVDPQRSSGDVWNVYKYLQSCFICFFNCFELLITKQVKTFRALRPRPSSECDRFKFAIKCNIVLIHNGARYFVMRETLAI